MKISDYQNRIAVLFGQFLSMLALLLFASLSAHAQCNVQQTDKLLPNDGFQWDHFGRSVAISGTTAIVGAVFDHPSGSAYLFDVTTGQQLAKLLPDDGGDNDQFGISSAISGTTAIVGARLDDDNGDRSGSAYLFDVTSGQQLAKLLPNDGAADDLFGQSVAISGSIAIVGASYDDDNGEDSGSAYLFDVTTGQQIAKLLPNDGAAEDYFGRVAISGNTAIVGAGGDDDNGSASGSAYLFDVTTGQQTAKLLPNDGAEGDRFGGVAISGTTAIVGARLDDDNGEDSGSAYLFDVITGQQLAKLMPHDGAAEDDFGGRVAISGTTAIVGARYDDDNGPSSGSAYLFDVTSGQQLAKLLPNDGAEGDHFSEYAVAISGPTAIVGAWYDDDNGDGSGSAYLFDIGCPIVVNVDGFNVLRGFYVSGDLADVQDSDDSYLKFNPGITLSPTEPPVWIEFQGTLPSDSPSSLSVTLEASANTVGLTQTIEMFNWNTAQYEEVDSQSASLNNDSVVTIELTDDIGDYVESGTGAVKTRTGWRATGLIFVFPWTICIDQVVWTATE